MRLTEFHVLVDEQFGPVRGASLLVDHVLDVSVAQVVVPDTRVAMGHLAAAFWGHPSRSLVMVGVTGTNGKTTTASLVASVLEFAGMPTGDKFKVVAERVLTRMAQLTPLMVVGDAQALHTALTGAHSVFVQDTQNNAYRASIEQLGMLFEQASRKLDIMPEAMLFPQLNTLCNSFTKYYQTVQKIAGSVPNCL